MHLPVLVLSHELRGNAIVDFDEREGCLGLPLRLFRVETAVGTFQAVESKADMSE